VDTAWGTVPRYVHCTMQGIVQCVNADRFLGLLNGPTYGMLTPIRQNGDSEFRME
jgi:hypothetical protein